MDTYDDFNNLITHQDASNNVTKSEYDALNRRTNKYDKVGNRLEETNGRGYTTEYQYDKLNRQIESRDPYQISDPVNDPPTKTQYFDTPSAVATALGELALTSPNVGKVVYGTGAGLREWVGLLSGAVL